MFFRTKTSGPRSYLQIVENRWEDGRPRQRVLATLGRLDQLQQSGQLDALLASGPPRPSPSSCFRPTPRGNCPTITTRRIGPALIFERLWQETGCRRVIERTPRRAAASSSPSSGPSSSPCCIASSRPAVTVPPRSGRTTTPSRVRRSGPAPPLPGHGLGRRGASERSAGGPRPSRPATTRISSRRRCSRAGATCSPIWTSCFSTPRRSTSRAKAARPSASADTRKIIVPT